MSNEKKIDNFIQKEKTNVIITNLNYLEKTSESNDIQVIRKLMKNKMKILPGNKVLDVGCGVGEELLDIAKIVGLDGFVVGIDVNEDAIEKANKKLSSDLNNAKFEVQNAEHIEYANNYFDSSRSERVFQHLKNPDKVLEEMIRVTKTGGIITVTDTDWDTLTINSENKQITRMIVHKYADKHMNGWSGRTLFSMFKQHNLKDIVVEPYVIQVYDFSTGRAYLGIDKAVENLILEKQITDKDAKQWWNELEEKNKKGLFFLSLVIFIVSGKK